MLAVARSNLIRNALNAGASRNARALSVSHSRNGSFKVQDDKDFLEKVENSKEPVIVDFFAT